MPSVGRRVTKDRGGSAFARRSEENSEFGVERSANERLSNAAPPDEEPDAINHVMREAQSLMQKHSQQPQFLLQLFHHASRITSNTDQQVALELLKELSYQRQQNNIQHNKLENCFFFCSFDYKS